MSKASRRTNNIIIGVIAAFVVIFIGSAVLKQSLPSKKSTLSGMTAVVYRSPTCGCCGNYIKYLEQLGVKVEEKLSDDMPSVKKQFGVPDSLTSCHTTEIGGYTVEGHVPIEAIEKLISEKPSVAGIGMAGMPAGSPGMPGSKYGTFDIYSFTTSGSSSAFMSL